MPADYWRRDDDSERALDQLLHQAAWPEPDATRLLRLRRRWLALRSAAPKPPLAILAAMAAGLMVATSAACWRWVVPAFRPEEVRVAEMDQESKQENDARVSRSTSRAVDPSAGLVEPAKAGREKPTFRHPAKSRPCMPVANQHSTSVWPCWHGNVRAAQ